LQRHHADAQPARPVHFMLAAELRGDTVHFALRLCQSDARLQFAENGEGGQIPRECVVGNLRGPPQFGIA
jgi:hypothetical protein